MIIKVTKTEDNEPKKIDWSKVSDHELVDVVSGDKVENTAKVKIAWTDKFLYIFFDVKDKHIWGTYRKDDDPIYEQEAVEVFIGFGSEPPKEYFELQFSPNLVKYDAWVKNPTGSRHDKDFDVDVSWNFKKLEFEQEIDAIGDEVKSGVWQTYIKIPAEEIKGSDFKSGDILRGNLFRIDGYPKQNSFQALNPNLEKTPNFHTPDKFATFELMG
jgi:hypothetical protein